MTELQFEKVFSKAQDLQTIEVTKKFNDTVLGLGNMLTENKNVAMTIKQAAVYLNIKCMNFAGEYDEFSLLRIHKEYIDNVMIIGENTTSDVKARLKNRKK